MYEEEVLYDDSGRVGGIYRCPRLSRVTSSSRFTRLSYPPSSDLVVDVEFRDDGNGDEVYQLKEKGGMT